MPGPEKMHASPQPQRLEALHKNPDEEQLGAFTPEEQQEITSKQKVLSSLAYFVGKDFEIPVLLNKPGGGWYWDQEKNHIKVDPKDLLEKPMDYLRFVICHEAGHRRISHIIDVIPKEVWQQPGFSFMFNALEDPRDNNFVAEAYPRFKNQMIGAYDLIDQEHQAQVKAKAELGHQPKSMQAGFEYMKQWLKEVKGEEFKIDPQLPADVQEVVQKTLPAAQDSWWRYPTKTEADTSEEVITQYAKTAYNIDYEQIWPEFKTLVDKDIERQTQQEALQEAIDEALKEGQQDTQSPMLPPELSDTLSPAEREELEGAMKDALEKSQAETTAEQSQQPIVDLDSLSEGLQQKIQDYVASLPEEVKEELRQKAEEAMRAFEEKISETLQGKLVPKASEPTEESMPSEEPPPPRRGEPIDSGPLKQVIEKVLAKDANTYEAYQREVLDTIVQLENDLREIFTERRSHSWQSGYKSGKKIDMKKRMQEEAKGVPVINSRAWEKREMPQEKDYAVELMVDLSGSMANNGKIEETFKAAIVLAEVLNRLSIKTEILGFNDRLYEYQVFGNNLSAGMREKMGGMLQEVQDHGPSGREKASYNDDGWAVEEASARLQKQKASEKLLIILSDGQPEPSPPHAGSEYDLQTIVQKITKETKQRIIGLGIGRGTEHVKRYYPNSIANVEVKKMAATLAELIKQAIVNG